MGFAVSWLAVRGKAQQDVLSQLRLRETPDRERVPESDIVASTLPSGWYLVFYSRDPTSLNMPMLAAISSGAEVITCAVEEHAMVSIAEGWRDGIKVWSVSHDSERGLTDLDTTGALPIAFSSIRDELLEKQNRAGAKSDVDYVFDVPVELARNETGFRHDADFDEFEVDPFVVLGRAIPAE
jgi:hypothetical protein